MPYIIGLPKLLYERASANRRMWSDFVLFDLDTKVFESPHTDSLPSDIHGYLRHNLKVSSQSFLSDNFARTFLRANALMFGRYHCGFSVDPETKGERRMFTRFALVAAAAVTRATASGNERVKGA